MKKILKTFIGVYFAFTTVVNAQQALPQYQLVWADEFNTDGPVDTAHWKFEQGLPRNHELQWYQKQNAICRDGKLIITAEKVHFPNPTYDPQKADWRTAMPNIDYTSSSINTKGLHSWKYGRFVMRGRIPTESGLWPAFWTMGVNGEWPSNGEIDIMEYYRGMVLANVATGTATAYQPKWFSKTKDISSFADPSWSEKFHTWRMDWDEEAISLYVDDLLLNRVELKDLINKDGTHINPFDQPHYILLNLAVGGDNGGDLSKTEFPKKFEVDFVRIYQKQ